MLFNFYYFKRIYYALAFLIAILLIGVAGFMLVEGYSFFNAFYMTIITVSTVGFQEVEPLSDAGRLFTSILIISSFGTFAFAVSSITGYLVTGEYKSYFKEFRVQKQLESLENHVIVCGYGRNGKQTVKTLQAHKVNFVVIDDNEDAIEQLRDVQNVPFIEGDATDEENIKSAGIDRAQALITTLPKDADNVFVVLTARELNSDVTIISRASNDSADSKLRIAGANNVIMPDKVGGGHMASLVVQPDLHEFLDYISLQGPGETNLEEITFNEIPEDFKNKTIGELDARYQTGALIIGFKNQDSEYTINPTADLTLSPGCKLFVLGTPEQIEKLNNMFDVSVN